MLKRLLPLFREIPAEWVMVGRITFSGSETMENSADISGLVAAWGRGDEVAFERLMTLLYPELRRMARRHLNHRPVGHTLESAALANEAYLKLIRAGRIQCENRVHFLALCSQVIRRILVDYARKRGYDKRGGDAMRTTLDDGIGGTQPRQIELLALDQALQSLAKIDARKSRVVELRYFGGLTLEEAAEVLGISVETAKRDWRMAKAWLFGALSSRVRNDASHRSPNSTGQLTI